MHKQLVNQCTIHLRLVSETPLLIKSGSQGADPTKPDMEFVETYHRGEKTIYLPGSSLKGAIRSHAERIVRTVGSDRPSTTTIWANDPTSRDATKQIKGNGEDIYKASSFTEQLFGNTSIASRIRIEDAYPIDPPTIEERNSVAIDRVLGSATGTGPFNYQVCTDGKFATKIHLRNFSLAQLGLLGLVLRDLNDGWFGLGYGKSRGLGIVKVEFVDAIVQYPTCELKNEQISQIGGSRKAWGLTRLLGAGEFLTDNNAYGFPSNDQVETPVRAEKMKFDFGVEMQWKGQEQVDDLFIKAVTAWKKVLQEPRK